MNPQNDVNFPSSSQSSSYFDYYQPHFQNPNPNPNPNPPFDHATYASAPPDPSFYSDQYNSYSTNYYAYDHNPTAAPNFGYSSSPAYDPNLVSSSYYEQFDQNQNQRGVSYGEGVYAYNGGSSKQFESKQLLSFDDYGRPITFGAGGGGEGNGSMGSFDSNKIVKAAPKVEMNEDVGAGVQKFRVKLLSEGVGEDMDVLCQIGLDGIQVLDPGTSRTLKIYPLQTVTRWEVLDSNIFAFWNKSSVDIDARRIRLKSNSYTTTNILDMVAAASIQLKEMGGDANSSDSHNVSEEPSEKKKGFPDWMNLINKPGNEEKDHWVPDEAVTKCTACSTDFGAFVRRHHCRNCGDIFCDKCTQGRIALTAEERAQPVRVCDQCMAEVTQRLSNATEVASRASGFHSHEDLAKKLQEEMEKKRRTTDMKSNVPDEQMREVECPTCTVHLQVQVPAAGSKTIECSVCQHPFLVNAH